MIELHERDSVIELFRSLKGLDQDDDIDDALSHAQRELRDLKSRISDLSKDNYFLESDVRYLDQRIALLIQRRMNTDEVSEVASRLAAAGRRGQAGRTNPTDDSVFTPEKLELYGALIFLMQNEPAHLVWLCSRVTMAEIDELLQTTMFSIYGDQFDAREEHLLLVMFQQVLAQQFETTTAFSSLLRANTPVSRMMMTYTRRGKGQAYLQKVVVGPVKSIIEADELDFSPLKVFAQLKENHPDDPEWTSTPLSPLSPRLHPRFPIVQKEIEERFTRLKSLVSKLLHLLRAQIDEIPYGIRWMAKQVRLLAMRKFPRANESQIASLIGGYFFLRFINPTIVTPHAYMLVDAIPNEKARRNLTMVAKILQVVANQASGAKEIYTVDVNGYTHELSKTVCEFLHQLCDVPDFYDSLELDQYFALTQTGRTLEISDYDLIALHQLLLKYQSDNLRLQDLLDEIGPPTELPALSSKSMVTIPLASLWHDADGGPTMESKELRSNIRFLEIKSLLVNIRRMFPESPRDMPLNALAECAARSLDPAIADRGHRAQLLLAALHQASDHESVGDAFSLESGISGRNEEQLLQEEVLAEVDRMGSMIEGLKNERQSLAGVYRSVREHNEYLRSQLETYRSYLNNVREQAGAHGLSTKALAQQQQHQQQKQEESALAHSRHFTPGALVERGVMTEWRFDEVNSQNMLFWLVTKPNGRYTLTLMHRNRPSMPLLSMRFSLDDILDFQAQSKDIDLRFARLKPEALLELLDRAN